MLRPRSQQLRRVANLLTYLGILLLVAGAVIGWLVPVLATTNVLHPLLTTGQVTVSSAHLDASSYLGADITALAVIIAVVIGFNATTLQIAGQTHSLSLVRVILVSLTP